MSRRDPAPPDEDETGPSLERLLYFSDAVFAIALTLLALDLPIPAGDSNGALWRSFVGHLDDEYLTFLISFLVISRFWMVQHRFFGRVRAADAMLVRLDLLYLLWIVLLPFATRVLDDGDHAFGTAFYAVAVALVGATFSGLVAWCVRTGLVTGRGADWRSLGRGSLVVAVVFLLSVPVAFWNADAGKYFWLVLLVVGPSAAAWRARRRRAANRRGSTTPAAAPPPGR